MRRRHPKKSSVWLRRKYLSAAEDKGLFSVWTHPQKGQSHLLTLYRMASTTIERHIKVRGTANHPRLPGGPRDGLV